MSWSEAEIEYLEEHYPRKLAKDISIELERMFGTKRSAWSVHKRAHRSGVRKFIAPINKSRIDAADEMICKLLDKLLGFPLDSGGINLVRDAQKFVGMSK